MRRGWGAAALAQLLFASVARADGGDIVEVIDDRAAPERGAPARSADGGNVVEVIDGGAAPKRGALAPSAPSNNRFQVSGWGLVGTEIGLSPPPAVADVTNVPHDASVDRAQLMASARYAHGDFLEVNVSGVVSYEYFERESGQRGPNGSSFFHSPRGQAEAILRELSVGWLGKRIDIRLGQQRLAWGNGDFFTPNDVVNPRDLRDPFVGEHELTRLPSPVARFTADLSALSVDAVVAPYFVPDSFDIYGTNWAAVQPATPQGLRGLFGLVTQDMDPTLLPDAQRLFAQTSLPARNLSSPVPSLKIAWNAKGWDFEQYYQFGFDGPLVHIDPALVGTLQGTDFTHAGLSLLAPILSEIDAGASPIHATYVRRHHFGTAAAVPIGSFVLRADVAYDTAKVFYTPALEGYSSPAVQGVVGVEYQTGDPAKTAIVEGFGLRMVDSPPELLVYERSTLGFSGVVRWPLVEGFGIEPRVIVGTSPRSYVLEPQITWKHDAITLTAGALVLGGVPNSFGEYYQYNSEVFTKAKLAF